MAPTYNGWEDTPEEEREALDLWEMADQMPRIFSRRSRASGIFFAEDSGRGEGIS